MAEWHDIASVEELERHGRVVARIAGREVGVVRDPADGRLVGLRNRCPHHGAPLCLGRVRDREAGSPGCYSLTGERVLRCPWHGWEFDLETGRCRDEPSLRVAVYAAKLVDGRVLVRA
jgi:3-phenylpropionate/trans-cinnamate dioxygenase ferredoxin subunit